LLHICFAIYTYLNQSDQIFPSLIPLKYIQLL